MTFDPTLYLITDSTGFTREQFLRVVDEACAGGVSLVQLREKSCSSRAYYSLALAVKAITDAYGVPLLIDDRADIALACSAAGVHVGTDDLPVDQARRLLGPDRLVGATAKTLERAKEAQLQGADYLGTGAIYATSTKSEAAKITMDALQTICASVSIPVCAIGGLTADNCGILAGSGIQGICAASAIMHAADPKAAAAALRQKAEQLKEHR